jgi:carbamoyltransferase
MLRHWARRHSLYCADDPLFAERMKSLRDKIDRGEPSYLIGIGAGGHDSGASLIEVSSLGETTILASHAEERFVGAKRYAGYPRHSLATIARQLDARGLGVSDIHAWLTSFDYVELFARGAESLVQELPGSLALIHPNVYPDSLRPMWRAFRAPETAGDQFSTETPIPLTGIPHHGNHAYFAWATSPFARAAKPALVIVADAHGDNSSVSCYLAHHARLEHLYSNDTFWDSLGHFYGFLSSSYGGWPLGDSEGRWMAASGYGNQNRETNPYYHQLMQLLRLERHGTITIDRTLSNWHRAGYRQPFSDHFSQLVWPPIPQRSIARGDSALDFSPSGPLPREAHLAAATQMVFEDALLHIARHWIATARCDRIILTGGAALNCIANMHLIERLQSITSDRVELWVPPAPADDGTHAGAALQFALRSGARPGIPLPHAFLCGEHPSDCDLTEALTNESDIQFLEIRTATPDSLGDLLSIIVGGGGVAGLFRGRAEIGRRALGNRSVFAIPTDNRIRDVLNRTVKHRETFRPFAPICTAKAANRWFILQKGASHSDYSGYRWMAIAARATPEARRKFPAAIHTDGTARIQIAFPDDTLMIAFLESLGRRIGYELAINTSLNLGTPIAQTPAQALSVLKRASGLDAILFVSRSGRGYLAWPRMRAGPYSRESRIANWLSDWNFR